MTQQPNSPLPSTSLRDAPLPTAKTLQRRNSVAFQLARFAVINLKMLRVIARGHGG